MSAVGISEVHGWHGDHKRIVVTVSVDSTNPGHRMGAAAGHYARRYGKALAMDCKAVMVRSEVNHWGSEDRPYWEASYDLVTKHLPVEEMFAQMRENRTL